MVIILFCEVCKRNNISMYVNNSLCATFYFAIRTCPRQFADMSHRKICIFILWKNNVHSMKPVAKGTRSIKSPLSVLPT